MLAVARTSSTWGGCVSVSMVSATFGFAASAFTLYAFGAVQTTICSPFQWNPIGITRGNPSNPV
jgi:hypothetical protein